MYRKQCIGKKGEDIAYCYLKDNNYEIIKRNFRCRQGEIDIICYDINLNELVFVEVKTRSNMKNGRPCEAVNIYKMKNIIYTSNYYIYKTKMTNIPIRFDVFEIILQNNTYKINHIKNAFFS